MLKLMDMGCSASPGGTGGGGGGGGAGAESSAAAAIGTPDGSGGAGCCCCCRAAAAAFAASTLRHQEAHNVHTTEYDIHTHIHKGRRTPGKCVYVLNLSGQQRMHFVCNEALKRLPHCKVAPCLK